jgi:hypothetical protein
LNKFAHMLNKFADSLTPLLLQRGGAHGSPISRQVKRHRRSCENFFLIPFFNPRGNVSD